VPGINGDRDLPAGPDEADRDFTRGPARFSFLERALEFSGGIYYRLNARRL
jgi:hypothetical protein